MKAKEHASCTPFIYIKILSRMLSCSKMRVIKKLKKIIKHIDTMLKGLHRFDITK